jgi:hypothetical protein
MKNNPEITRRDFLRGVGKEELSIHISYDLYPVRNNAPQLCCGVRF